MRTKNRRLAAALMGACLYAFALPAVAQERPAGTAGRPAQPSTGSDLEAATETVESWEPIGFDNPYFVEDAFFRTVRDFAGIVVLDSDRLGQVPLWPRGEIKVGPVRILPYLREAVEYDSNWYDQPETGSTDPDYKGRDAQWSHVHELGLLADMMAAGGRLRLAAAANPRWTVVYDHEKPDGWEADANFTATYRWPSSLWVSGLYQYERRNDPIDYVASNSDFDRTDQWVGFSMGMDRDLIFGSKFVFSMGISNHQEVAQDDTLDDLDRNELELYVRAAYPFWKKTTQLFVLGTWDVDNRQSDQINDGKSFGLSVGMDGSIPLAKGSARSLRGEVSIGFSGALYESDSFESGSDQIATDDNRRENELIGTLALQYVQSPRTTWDLRYTRDNEFAFVGNYETVDHIELTISHNLTRQLVGRLQTYYEHVDPSGTVPAASYDQDQATEPARNRNELGAGVGLRYAWNDWIDLDASLSVNRDNASQENSFTDYEGVLGITFHLNALKPRARSTPAP